MLEPYITLKLNITGTVRSWVDSVKLMIVEGSASSRG